MQKYKENDKSKNKSNLGSLNSNISSDSIVNDEDDDINFDGKNNVYSVTGDVGKANSMHVFSAIALLHDRPNAARTENSSSMSRKSKIIISALVAAVLLILLVLVGNDCIANANVERQIARVTNLSESQAKDIKHMLDGYGISPIDSIKFDNFNKKGVKTYRIISPRSDKIVLCLNSDGTVSSLTYKGQVLYEKLGL